MKTIIGLGNPIPEYLKTRHNIGEHVVNVYVKSINTSCSPKKLFEALYAKAQVGQTEVQFILPQTYMNDSGKSLVHIHKKPLLDEYSDTLVIRDDIDLPLGTIKLVYNSGSAGHKGNLSVEKYLGTKAFYQLKLGVLPKDSEGIIRKPDPLHMPNFVIGTFTQAEWALVEDVTKKAVQIVTLFIQGDISKAMEFAHTKI